MAQAGLHALIGGALRKLAPKRDWILLGILLGSLFPDLDNYAVAIATVSRLNTSGLHRTFTHSIVTALAILLLFSVTALVAKRIAWFDLGVGLSIGLGLHIALDLLIWFNGVELLWPFGGWVNLWESVTPPTWFMKLMDPLEFLFMALYLWWLYQVLPKNQTDSRFGKPLRVWLAIMIGLFLLFTPLAYVLTKGFLTIFGAAYLVCLTACFVLTINLRQTINQLS